MRLILLFLVMISLSSCISRISKKIDLDFIYMSIVVNHPGIYNNLDPSFKRNLKTRYINSKRDLTKAIGLEEQKKSY